MVQTAVAFLGWLPAESGFCTASASRFFFAQRQQEAPGRTFWIAREMLVPFREDELWGQLLTREYTGDAVYGLIKAVN